MKLQTLIPPTFLIFILLIGCKQTHKNEGEQKSIFEIASTIEDSIRVGGMVIHNAFKYQILAHQDGNFDSTLISSKVYKPNQYVFDSCLSQIFGSNGRLFEKSGLNEWNKELFSKHDSLIRDRMQLIASINLNDLFKNHLQAVQNMTGQTGEGTWMVYFGPKHFQILGGCDNDAMVLDLTAKQMNSEMLNKVFAHELEHLVFGPILARDPNGDKGLGITLDEGLAVYFTYKYLKHSYEEALYGEETEVLLNREKEIFQKLEPYFYKDNEEGCPIFRHCGRNNTCKPVIEGLPENIENELCYFLGFRIIEKYTQNHGESSWKDIYKMPLKEFYLKSGYKEYIEVK